MLVDCCEATVLTRKKDEGKQRQVTGQVQVEVIDGDGWTFTTLITTSNKLSLHKNQ